MQTLMKDKTYTVWREGAIHRAEPERWNGKILARRLLEERLGVSCFGKMRYPDEHFFGGFSVTGASEADALEKAQEVEAEYRKRIEAGVDQLVKCAACRFNESCFRIVMASKHYAN